MGQNSLKSCKNMGLMLSLCISKCLKLTLLYRVVPIVFEYLEAEDTLK